MKEVKCAECGEPKQVIESEYKKDKNQGYETSDLPDTVECPRCKTETAEQVDNDQLYKCTECGRETVMIGSGGKNSNDA